MDGSESHQKRDPILLITTTTTTTTTNTIHGDSTSTIAAEGLKSTDEGREESVS